MGVLPAADGIVGVTDHERIQLYRWIGWAGGGGSGVFGDGGVCDVAYRV